MRRTVSALDEVDRRIVAELSRDGRLSVRALAERLHISRANAYSRLERLTRDQVVRGFSARLDPVGIGLALSAYVTLTIEQNSWKRVRDRLREIPAIRHYSLTGGDFDVIALVRVPDQAGLRDLVFDDLHSIPGVRNTRTMIIFEESSDDMVLRDSPWPPVP
ncbi:MULTISPECIES: Lrp/AsnC family transcriptional regulator [Thermomonosporaceae]|uniref:Lrp/AsnC family transcriptional regulator n=1 Tax=Thermomonosporaceae TaxID=2012 RepID=UPI00255A7819|nr:MULTISPECIES: Lrp/AsnC family transcriptional regulator [Thermomonosporaceae]MDL4772443.1 Lrp/AsnC family transcriptional regulator [Actinomadura xylanilytica]